jgi:hypothetical protein
VAGERESDGSAYALRGSGDERDFAGEVSGHEFSCFGIRALSFGWAERFHAEGCALAENSGKFATAVWW